MQRPYELLKYKIPSLSDFSVQERINKTDYFQYLAHFFKHENLSIEPVFEIRYLIKKINQYKKVNNWNKVHQYTKLFYDLVMAVQENGKDDTDLYELLNEMMNLIDYPESDKKYYSRKKIEYFIKLLDDLNHKNEKSEKRADYIIQILISLLKEQLHNNTVLEFTLSDVYVLIKSCITLNSYDKYKDTILLVIETIMLGNCRSLFENYYGISDKNKKSYDEEYDNPVRFEDFLGGDNDSHNIYFITQILIANNEINTLKRIINLLNKDSGNIPFKKLKLSAMLYAIKLTNKTLLSEFDDINIHQEVLNINLNEIHSLENFTRYVFKQLGNLKYYNSIYIYTEYFTSLMLQRYSENDLAKYFSKMLGTTRVYPEPVTMDTNPSNSDKFDACTYILTKTNIFYYDAFFKELHDLKADKKQIEKASKLFEHGFDYGIPNEIADLLKYKPYIKHYLAFISVLFNRLDKNKMAFLDINTKLNIHKRFDYSNVFKLLNNQNRQENEMLIKHYRPDFQYIYQNRNINKFIYDSYPLQEIENQIPYTVDENMPTGFYLSALTEQEIISESFGYGLLELSSDPASYDFMEIKYLLKNKNGIIKYNNELYYTDLKKQEIKKLKLTVKNQPLFSKLQSKFIHSYQLADKEANDIIISLRQKTPAFYDFLNSFQKANKYAENNGGENIVVEYSSFMINNASKLSNLFQLMGDSAFIFMKKMIGTSNQKLKRYIKNYNCISKEYRTLIEKILKMSESEALSKSGSNFDILLLQISQLELLLTEFNDLKKPVDFSRADFIQQLDALLDQSESFDVSSKFILKTITTLYVMLLNLPETTELDMAMIENDFCFISRLLTARKAMREHKLCNLFDKIIEHDIRKDVQFYDYANNVNQTDPLGKKLSQYNQNIMEILGKGKINVKLALNYNTVMNFSIKAKNTIDLPGIANALYSDILNLKNIFSDKINHPEILHSIQLIQNQVEKKVGVKTITPIHNGVLDRHINSISHHLDILLKTNTTSELQEHGRHFLDRKKQLFDARLYIKKNPKDNSMNKKTFELTIKQWDKNLKETSILGDYVGCCLAPDGGQFPAMVQRRMDNAMMMHVIYDNNSNEPVCLNWLFFACDKKNPNDIYVVANFFEIRASYALDKDLNQQLVDALLKYTDEYAHAVGAKGLLMRPLNYGLISDFKDKYAKKKMQIDKIGGFFDPTGDDDHDYAKSRYYLDALDLDEFYIYETFNLNLIMCAHKYDTNSAFHYLVADLIVRFMSTIKSIQYPNQYCFFKTPANEISDDHLACDQFIKPI